MKRVATSAKIQMSRTIPEIKSSSQSTTGRSTLLRARHRPPSGRASAGTRPSRRKQRAARGWPRPRRSGPDGNGRDHEAGRHQRRPPAAVAVRSPPPRRHDDRAQPSQRQATPIATSDPAASPPGRRGAPLAGCCRPAELRQVQHGSTDGRGTSARRRGGRSVVTAPAGSPASNAAKAARAARSSSCGA